MLLHVSRRMAAGRSLALRQWRYRFAKAMVFARRAVDPAAERHIIMRARVGNAVGRGVVLGQIGALGIIVKGKLQYFHARIAGILQQLPHFRCHKAQIFRNDRQVAQCFLDSLEQSHARALTPLAHLGSFFAVGDRIKAFEAAEVVDTHGVVQCGCTFQPLDPPCKTGFLMILPVIQRIAPQLTGR